MISFIPEEVGRCRELAFVEPAVINVFTGTHGTEAGGRGERTIPSDQHQYNN